MDSVQRPDLDRSGSDVGVVFVDVIKEPYISAAAPQGLLLLADPCAGRWLMKRASLRTHRCEVLSSTLSAALPLFFFFFFI